MRYYKIDITKADGTPFLFKSLGVPLTSLLRTGPQNPISGIANPGALNVEFEIPFANLTNPSSNSSWLRIWGLGLQDIGNAADLNGLSISISAGMSSGLPLANPAQAGLLMQGTIFQAYGNWINTDQTVDINFFPAATPVQPASSSSTSTPQSTSSALNPTSALSGAPTSLAGVSFSWNGPVTLPAAISQAIQAASANISASLSTAIGGVSSSLQSAVSGAIGGTVAAELPGITSALSSAVNGAFAGINTNLTGAIGQALESIPGISSSVSTAIGSTLTAQLSGIATTLSGAINTAITAPDQIAGALSSVVDANLPSLTGTMVSAVDSVTALLPGINDAVSSSISQLIPGVLPALNSTITSTLATAQSALAESMTAAVNTQFAGLASVSQSLATATGGVLPGIAATLSGQINSAVSALSGVTDELSSAVNDTLTIALPGTILSLSSAVTEGLPAITDTLSTAINGAMETALPGITSVVSGAIGGILPGLAASLSSAIANAVPKAPQQLSSAISKVLSTAMPGYAQVMEISEKLVQNFDAPGVYQSLGQFADHINKLSRSIIGGSYRGVTMAVNGSTVRVFDGSVSAPAGSVKQIAFQDMIGQPTWQDDATISLKLVLRADIKMGDVISIPPDQWTISSGSAAFAQQKSKSPDNSSSFSGNYRVNNGQHHANFRQGDAASWNTTLQIFPELSGSSTAGTNTAPSSSSYLETGSAANSVG